MAAATEAADGVTKLKLRLVHGTKVHNICVKLPCSKQGGVLTVSDIVTVVEKVANVPARYQKLISKGKTLDPNSKISLKEQGFKDNSKILLLGKKLFEAGQRIEDDKILIQTNVIPAEVGINFLQMKLSNVIHAMDGIHRGYLARDNVEGAVCQARHCLYEIYKECEQYLFDLDVPLYCCESKERRKKVLDKIQNILTRRNELQVSLNELVARFGPRRVMPEEVCLKADF